MLSVMKTKPKNEKVKLLPEVLIGLDHVFSEGISISNKIEKFKKRYIGLVKKSQEIMPKKKFSENEVTSPSISETPNIPNPPTRYQIASFPVNFAQDGQNLF